MYQWSGQLEHDPQVPNIPASLLVQEYLSIGTGSPGSCTYYKFVDTRVCTMQWSGQLEHDPQVPVHTSIHYKFVGTRVCTNGVDNWNMIPRFLYIPIFPTSLLVQECVPVERAIGI